MTGNNKRSSGARSSAQQALLRGTALLAGAFGADIGERRLHLAAPMILAHELVYAILMQQYAGPALKLLFLVSGRVITSHLTGLIERVWICASRLQSLAVL